MSANTDHPFQKEIQRSDESKFTEKIRYGLIIGALVISLAALYFLSRYNYLLFHSIVEIFSIVIAFAIFAVAWNSRRFTDSSYLLFIGIAFLFIGGLDTLHMLAYKGMGVFPNVETNLATQLWISARYVEGFALFIPLLFIGKKFRSSVVFAGFFAVTAVLLAAIYFGVFPAAFVNGIGLTPFKIVSEYVISFMLLGSIGLLWQNRIEFDSNVTKLLIAAMAVTIASEMAFTLYADPYGVANMVGHLLKVVAFYFIYKALVETGLSKPYNLLFHNLKQRETSLNTQATELAEANSRLIQEAAERKKAEERLKEYQMNLEKLVEERTKQLKDSERLAAIGATAGMVGHDIRNPLQAMTGDIYLAKTDLTSISESEEKKSVLESLQAIEKNIDYINKIVADLQDFAKPLTPRSEVSDLKLIIDELLKKNNLPENVEVNVKIESQSRVVLADFTFLNRIMYNLVTNAVQAMPQGGKLTILAHKDTKTNDSIITVEDTGVGIPEHVKGKLFTPMFTTKAKGQGFGLAVIKRMTEALGGSVTFESEEGKGTTFIVRLPPPKK